MKEEIINLKKKIKYRLFYTGTKETDIIYKKLILNKLNDLNTKDLVLLANLFNDLSDNEIFNILTNKLIKPIKYQDLINKLINE